MPVCGVSIIAPQSCTRESYCRCITAAAAADLTTNSASHSHAFHLQRDRSDADHRRTHRGGGSCEAAHHIQRCNGRFGRWPLGMLQPWPYHSVHHCLPRRIRITGNPTVSRCGHAIRTCSTHPSHLSAPYACKPNVAPQMVLEHAMLGDAATPENRNMVFARYNLGECGEE